MNCQIMHDKYDLYDISSLKNSEASLTNKLLSGNEKQHTDAHRYTNVVLKILACWIGNYA